MIIQYNAVRAMLYFVRTVSKIAVVAEWRLVVNATINIKYHVHHVLRDYVLKRSQKKNFVRIVNTHGQEEHNE